MNDEARARIAANDKLLKAVITLLAIKDPGLLDELDIIFAIAEEEGSTLAETDRRTRIHLKQELELIRNLASTALETTH
ncbi:hypothetical protein JNB91_21435 [Rhizobium wenxiniae]|uniref:hypothetical protein n=1 Tax=Rhizobium wenxiniae TaxID=1737357 RepID=UPI001C6E699A|nr:hypothetical protein [Rhizobium wenxiniae]MBW9090380.1 hypothetical protein [Rhizobium wenxiniae]